MRNWKKMLSICVIAAGLIAGCSDGVNQQKLAELTAGKNLQQIEKDYTLAVFNSKKEDASIYAYWLQQNGSKAQPGFNFDLFQMKAKADKQKLEKQIDDQIHHLPKMSYNSLKMLRTQAAFMGLNLKIFKDKLLPAISAEIHHRLYPKSKKDKR